MTFANVWQRVGAFLLDYLIIAAYIAFLVIVSKKHQALYDWIAGTYVVVAPHPDRTKRRRSATGKALKLRACR